MNVKKTSLQKFHEKRRKKKEKLQARKRLLNAKYRENRKEGLHSNTKKRLTEVEVNSQLNKLEQIHSKRRKPEKFPHLATTSDSERKKTQHKNDIHVHPRNMEKGGKRKNTSFICGYMHRNSTKRKELAIWRFKTAAVAKLLNGCGPFRNKISRTIKQLEIENVYNKMIVKRSQIVKLLRTEISRLRTKYKYAASMLQQSQSAEEINDIVRACYGGHKYHSKTNEAYGFAKTEVQYQDLNMVKGLQSEAIMAEHDEITATSEIEHMDVDVDTPLHVAEGDPAVTTQHSTVESDNTSLGRLCDDSCKHPDFKEPIMWASRFHKALGLVVKENLQLSELIRYILDFDKCRHCGHENYPFCEYGESCQDIIKMLRKTAPHYVGIRTIIRTIYRARAHAYKLSMINAAIEDGNYKAFCTLVNSIHVKEKGDKTSEEATEEQLPKEGLEGHTREKYKRQMAEFEQEIFDFPARFCIVCNMLFKKGNGITLKSIQDLRREASGNSLNVVENLDERIHGPINVCACCRSDIKSGRVPLLSKHNNMMIDDLPKELLCLNNFETILIKLAKTFQTIVRLHPLREIRNGDLVQALRGFSLHLPLPLEETINYVNKTLPSADNMEIIVDSCPTNKKLVWRMLVDMNKVHAALTKLKEINVLYKNVHIDMNQTTLTGSETVTVINDVGRTSELHSESVKSMLKVGRDCEEYQDVTIEPINSGFLKERTDTEIYHTNRVSGKPIFSNDPYMDLKCFPELFPTGRGGTFSERLRRVLPPMYLKHKLLNKDPRFRCNAQYYFQELSRYHERSIEQGIYATMNTTQLTNLTAGALKRQIESNSQELENNLSMMFSKVRGTKEYWNMISTDLQAMDECLGPATFFVTLSAAEYFWPDMRARLEVMNEDVDNVQQLRSSFLASLDPVTVSCQFHKRFKALLKVLLSNGQDKPLGEIEHYFARVEYQARGAPHIHMKLWIKDAPIVGRNKNEEIASFIDKYICCTIPNESTDPELSKLVNKFQTHKCCATCLRRKKLVSGQYTTRCRFGFPRKSSSATIINGTERSLLSRKQGKAGKLYDLLRTTAECKINDYNPFLLLLWQANIDIQYVGERSQILNRYITSYMTKSEQNASEEIWKQIDSEKPIRTRLRKYSRKYLQQRETGAYEGIDKLLGHHLFYSSCSIRYLNTNFRHMRRRKIKKYTELQKLSDDSDSIYCHNIIDDYYPNRPDEFDRMSLFEFASWFEKVAARETNNASVDGTAASNRWHLKNDLGIIRRRIKRQLIKTPYHNAKLSKENEEKYYHSLLMLFKPWRNEDEILGDFETYKDAFVNASEDLPEMVAYDERKQNVFQMAQVERQIQEENERQVNDEDNNHDAVNSPIAVDNEAIESQEENLSQGQYLPPVNKVMLADKLQNCNSNQIEIINKVITTINEQSKDKTNTPIQLIVSGVAGTGKSYVIEILTDLIRSLPDGTDDNVAVLAPTGIAAFNINGQTIHRFFKLPVQHGGDPKYWRLPDHEIKQFRRMWSNLKLIIIDEFSMVSNTSLAMIDRRLCDCFGYDNAFANMNIVLFGDLLQLPPVCSQFCFERLSVKKLISIFSSAINPDLWANFKYAELEINMRQANDQNYANMLSRIRLGSPMESDIAALRSRLINDDNNSSVEQAASFFKENLLSSHSNTVCLCPTHELVDNFNSIMLQECNIDVTTVYAIDTTGHRKKSRKQKQNQRQKPNQIAMKRRKASETAGLEDELRIGIGARVMLLRNINVSGGLVNGALGTITSITVNSGNVSALKVKFGNAPSETMLERIKVTYEISKGIMMDRSQFPICLAYAITIHKCQGLTLERALINIGTSCFEDAMAYVALSRVRSFSNLHLWQFDPSKIRCKRIAVQEYSRLRESIYMTAIETYNLIPEKYKQKNNFAGVSKSITVTKETEIKSAKQSAKLNRKELKGISQFSNNDGVSCYANVIANCIIHMPKLIQHLNSLNTRTAVEEEIVELHKKQCNGQQTLTLLRLRQLVGRNYSLNLQQDASEFFSHLIQMLSTLSQDLFTFLLRTHVECAENPNAEWFLHPELHTVFNISPVDGKNVFRDLLTHHPNVEIGQCQCGPGKAIRTLTSVSIPNQCQYICIYINLFTDGNHRMSNRSIVGLNANSITIGGVRFRTITAVQHSGRSMASGHYTSWVRHDEQWIQLDDLQPFKFASHVRFISKLSNVYLMFLERL